MDARMKWWKDARFGLFLHWGLYSTQAGEWNGKTNYAEWLLEEAHIPVSQYEQFQSQFNPVNFDADKWASMAKNAGMKYIVITSKHHEGFNMFASKYSDYNVMNTPFHRDPLKELAAACKKYGLKMCWYHSIMDWHHPDYLPRRSWESRPVDGADFRRYVQYLRNDVTQLLTEYGPIGIMWFDGEWESTWNHADGQALYDLCRKLQPNVIVNNRVDVGRAGVAGMSTAEGTAGDYGTPEQEIPPQGIPGSYWETCMTMNDHWGYNKNDLDYKSDKDLIQKLVDISSKGGNFLLNIGPTGQGEFPPLAQDRLKALGTWMHTNSDAIYSTDASPFATLPWGRCTQKSEGGTTTLYLDVFNWPADGKLVVPGISNRFGRAVLLADRDHTLPVVRDGSDIVITVPVQAPDPNCSVISLQISGKPVVYSAPVIRAATDLLFQPVMAEISVGSPNLEVRYTTDGSDPRNTSLRYKAPVRVTGPVELRARTFDKGKPVSSVTVMRFRKADLSPSFGDTNTQPGLLAKVFEGDWDSLPAFSNLTPAQTTVITGLSLDRWPKKEHFGLQAVGYLNVPEDAVYLFELSSDDGSRLMIDGSVVIDNDGLHSSMAKVGSAALAKGLHRIEVDYFNKTGGMGLSLNWGKAGDRLGPVVDSSFSHPANSR